MLEPGLEFVDGLHVRAICAHPQAVTEGQIVNPHHLIMTVLVDPRAADSAANAFTPFLKQELNFKGRVAKSVLYEKPQLEDWLAGCETFLTFRVRSTIKERRRLNKLSYPFLRGMFQVVRRMP